MDKLKTHYRSKTKGQILAVLIIVLGLIGVGAWWLYSTRGAMAKEGREFGNEAIQRIVLQHDLAFFSSHLSPAARQENPPSMQQEFMSGLEKLGAPVSPPQVQGDIQFQSQFFEPRGNFIARVNYPARGAQISISISHPVGRWQIDSFSFFPDSAR
jgi:hypothetical protein